MIFSSSRTQYFLAIDGRSVLGCAVLLAVVSGCAQRNFYYANKLPTELMAPRTASVQKLDLSGLARGNVKAELIYPGDVLSILVMTGLEDKLPDSSVQRVTDDGTVNVPLVGPIPVAGLTLPEVERLIQAEGNTRGYFRDPQVSVSLKNRRVNNVTVVGAVNSPGVMELPVGSCDVLSALVAAGGLAKEAGMEIEVRHPAGVTTIVENEPPPGSGPRTELAGFRRRRQVPVPARASKVNLAEASANANADLHLEDGSVVMVMKQPDRIVHVSGLVKKSDQFHLPVDQDIYLLDAIAMAGGRTLEMADKVRVIRKLPGREEPAVIEASVSQAKRDGRSNIRLYEGDIVTVEETPLTFTVGVLREFVKFGVYSTIPFIK